MFKHSATYFFIVLCVCSSILHLHAQEQSDTFTIDSLGIVVAPKKSSQAIDAKVVYSSVDSIIFDVQQKKVIAFGASEIQYDDITLDAYFVELDLPMSEIFAKGTRDTLHNKLGYPRYRDASDVFDADSMKYNFRTRRGVAYGIITQQDDAFLHGGKTKIHDDKAIHIQHGKYTTCDAEEPHFHVFITRGKVMPNDKIIFGPAWLVIDEIPIPLVIPFGFFPNKKGQTNGIIFPSFGEETGKGFYAREFGVYLGFSDYVDFRLTSDYYTLGSWRSHMRSQYAKRYTFTGSLDVSYASLVLDETRQPSQFNVRWSHTQDPRSMSGGSFTASVNYGSVGFARQNTMDHEEFLNNRISSTISYSKRFTGTPFGVSSSLLHSQNNLDSTINLTLPQLTLSMSSVTPFANRSPGAKQRFYNRVTVSYSGSFQNKLSNAKLDSSFYSRATLEAFEYAVNHQIPVSTSIPLLRFFTLSPSFNYQERWYFEKIERSWDDTKQVVVGADTTYGGVEQQIIPEFNRVYNYSMGAGLSTKIYGMYQFRSRYLRAMRHVITPQISYRYSPDFSDEKYGYYATYQSSADGTMSQYSHFSNMLYGQPGTSRQSAIDVSIGNNIEAKIRDVSDTVTGTKKIKLIERLTISGSYNFAADSLNMSLIRVSGNTRLFQRLDVQYSSTLDPYVLMARESGNTTSLVRANSYMLDSYNTLWRKTEERWQTSAGYTFGPIPNKEKMPTTSEFDYWDVPWSLRLSYSLSVPRQYYYNEFNQLDSVQTNIVQTLGINGSFSLTKNWNISYRTGWDFTNKGLSYTTLNIYRDLHCWQMTFNWVPLGDRQRWDFTIRVKADMLKDLKLDMRSSSQYF